MLGQSTVYQDFIRVSNLNSEYPFFVSIGKELLYKHLNLTKNTVHFLIYRNPELLLPGEALIELWDKKITLEEFVNKKFMLDVDIYYQTPYLKHKMNDTNVGFIYYNGLKDLTIYNQDRQSIVNMFKFLYQTKLILKEKNITLPLRVVF